MEIPGICCRKDGSWECVVWAPHVERLDLVFTSPSSRFVSMEQADLGYWRAALGSLSWDTHYFFRLDGEIERPDPASRHQPEGVHGPSRVVDHRAFPWRDDSWEGLALAEMVLYEIHVGTFTPAGTFEAVIPRLDQLVNLGVTALELMPVAQFPGERNWGYDGVYPYAVQHSYGGPEGLKKLVDACHRRGMAVVLDVVHNHLGPEGNYLSDFAPYFTDRTHTPWGEAVNFDGPFSDEVRRFFIGSALHWFEHYHVDALRLDAVHAIHDRSATPFLQELARHTRVMSRESKRPLHLIAESDFNDSRIVGRSARGGSGLDALWCDDYHHALHVLLTGESSGYYLDYGGPEDLVKALREGFVYSGQYSRYRRHSYGNSSAHLGTDRFVVFSQNHDHVGNRMGGERLTSLVSFEGLKLAAGAVLLSPYIPLLFMGEEYGEEAPFLYFVSHSDPDLVESVRRGRRNEFSSFHGKGEPPDPQAEETFRRSVLDWDRRRGGRKSLLNEYYRELLRLRRRLPVLRPREDRGGVAAGLHEGGPVWLHREDGKQGAVVLMNFDGSDRSFFAITPAGVFEKVLDSADVAWDGPGSELPEVLGSGDRLTMRARSVVLYRRGGRGT